MKCPICLNTMECITKILPIPNQLGKNLMSLHCKLCDHRKISHMTVITNDSNKWICHSYGLYMIIDNSLYVLCGYDKVIDPANQSRELDRQCTWVLKINENYVSESIILIEDFIPISTDNDMHLDAENLLNRLLKLVIYS